MKNAVFLCMLAWLGVSGCGHDVRPDPGKAGNLTVLTEAYAPLNFMQDGEVTGQATDVVRALMKRTGTAADIRLVKWEEGYDAVLKRGNTALFSTVMTAERKPRLQWVGPLATLDTNLYAVKGSGIDIRTLDEARSAGAIATVAGYYTEQVLKQAGFRNLRSHPDEETAVRALLSGKVRLLVSNNTVMPAALERAGADMSDVESAFTVSTDLTYIAFSRATSPDLVAGWQNRLDEMKWDGSFQAIYAKWLPAETPPGVVQLMTEEYPPVTFMKAGKPAGIVTDIVRAIAARMNIPDDIRLTSWKNAYNMALLHPNVVLFSAERTPEREDRFHWVGPVGKNTSMLYARKGSGIRVGSLAEAKAIGAIGTTTDWFTEQHLKREGFANLVSSKDPADNVRQLMKGEVDLSVFTDLTVPEIVKAAGYRMADLEPVLTVSQTYFYIALSRDTPPERVKAWQAALDGLKADGSFAEIYGKYLPHADLDGLLAR
jgi:polar amino acid transport system substrate-binding protein